MNKSLCLGMNWVTFLSWFFARFRFCWILWTKVRKDWKWEQQKQCYFLAWSLLNSDVKSSYKTLSFLKFQKMISVGGKYEGFKKAYILGILTICYILGELGHYLIGVTSRATAREVWMQNQVLKLFSSHREHYLFITIKIDYGDHACQLNDTTLAKKDMPQQCEDLVWVTVKNNFKSSLILLIREGHDGWRF